MDHQEGLLEETAGLVSADNSTGLSFLCLRAQ